MAKKKRKQPAGKSRSVKLTKESALKLLKAKEFNQAKNAFKELIKKDREGCLPHLIECYKGLASQMATQGNFEKSQQFIDKIKSLSADAGHEKLEFDIAVKTKAPDYIARTSIAFLNAAGELPPIEHQPLFADALVLTFQQHPTLQEKFPLIHDELVSVQKSLELVCGEDYPAARNSMKKLGFRSIFSNWRFFIKGLIAFYENEDEKAASAFERIPVESLLHPAIDAMNLLLKKSGENAKKGERTYANSCLLAGHPELISVLPKATRMWETGRYLDSYRHVRENLAEFPETGNCVSGILSRFFFNIFDKLPEQAAEKYIEAVSVMARTAPEDFLLEKLLAVRMVCICEEKGSFYGEEQELIELWNIFIEFYAGLYEESNALISHIHSHLGTYFFKRINPKDKLLGYMQNKHYIKLAENAFNKSAAADPKNKAPLLKLLELYGTTGNKSKKNKLLDKLIKLFPNEKKVVIEAGTACLNRKAYTKAVTYLEHAQSLDSLDNEVKGLLAKAYTLYAEQCCKKRMLVKMRELMEKAIALSVQRDDDFERGKPYMYVRWASFEYQNNHMKDFDQKTKLAFEAAEDPLILTYFSLFLREKYPLPGKHTKELTQTILKGLKQKASTAKGIQLLKIMDFQKSVNKGEVPLKQALVSEYLKKAIKTPCTKEEALYIIDFSYSNPYLLGIAKKYVTKILKLHKNDPVLLFAKHEIRKREGVKLSNSDIRNLEKILDLIDEEKDSRFYRKVEDEMFDLEESIYGDPFDIYGDDNEDDSYDDGFTETFPDPEAMKNIPDIEEMIEMLKQMPYAPPKKKKGKKQERHNPGFFD